ncbi:hypothetical protein AB0O90_07080 [Microbacterium testaceum]|uniref:hypothetical protein n=1 Tax=Microbacterium testaceum TaxID=2033 RepID=UPI003446E58A
MSPSRSLSGQRIAIFEPDARGHRLYYVRILATSLRESGVDVEIVTSDGAASTREWEIHLGDVRDLTFRVLEKDASLEALGLDSDSHTVDLTIVPDGDRYLIDAIRGRWKARGSVSLLAMRADAQHSSGLRSLLWGLAKKLLIYGADRRKHVRAAALKSSLADRKFPIRWVSDPVTLACSATDVQVARSGLDSDGSRFWVGVFGAVTPRKNLNLVAKALLEVPGAALLVAGSIDDASWDLAKGPLDLLVEAGREVMLRTEPLRDVEFDALIASVDCVVAAHTNEGPSGIVGKAHAARRPLVLAGAKTLRDDARQIGGMAAWSELDSTAIAQNIRRFAEQPPTGTSLSSDVRSFVDGLTE